jgi:hypothetical protein
LDRHIKRKKKEERKRKREDSAQRLIFKAWRAHRVHLLLNCVILFIRNKAANFRAEEIEGERNFRMRTAMRRVNEEKEFKLWVAEQRKHPTFPAKQVPSTVGPALVPSPRWIAPGAEDRAEEGYDDPAAATAAAAAAAAEVGHGTAHRRGQIRNEFRAASMVSALSVPAYASGGNNPVGGSSGTSTTQKPPMKFKSPQEKVDYEYHRPDLAPFSTMINNMIQKKSLYFAKPKETSTWEDIATVKADFLDTYKKNKKSPAYRTLEKFCGISQEEVVRSKLVSHNDAVNLKLKAFGASIVSL